MDEAKYVETQSGLIVLGQMANTLDLEGFIEAANHAETVGPFVDPTLYRQGAEKLGRIKRLAEAALKFKRAVQKAVDEEMAGRVSC